MWNSLSVDVNEGSAMNDTSIEEDTLPYSAHLTCVGLFTSVDRIVTKQTTVRFQLTNIIHIDADANIGDGADLGRFTSLINRDDVDPKIFSLFSTYAQVTFKSYMRFFEELLCLRDINI